MSAWRAAHAKIAAHWRIRCQPRWKSDFGIPAARPHLGKQALQATFHIQALRKNPMDAERINQIGNTLSELGARTEDLRRYL